MIFTDALQYLASNRLLLVGAATTVSELTVIVVNTIRRCRAVRTARSEEKRRYQIYEMDASSFSEKTILTKANPWGIIRWAANPLNLFRSPER